MYLVHQPLVFLMWRLVGQHHTLLLSPLIVGIGYLFPLAFERPFMSSPPPKTERQAEAAAIISPAP